jgi:ribonuclease HII
MGDVERWAKARDLYVIAGLDEAGRGPLAGPVVAACVVLPPGTDRRRLRGLDDSKRLSESIKDRLYDRILPLALASKVAFASRAEIDELNILQASLLAMKRALEGALDQLLEGGPQPQLVVVDGRQTIDCRLPQRAFVKGDSRSHNIAAASVLAKVSRDRHMVLLDEIHPGYGFAKHKGYPTAEHRAAIVRLGPCTEHRTSFRLLPS